MNNNRITFIAELCQNHNGSFANILKMADAAAEAGATHIKLQHIFARNLVYRPEFELKDSSTKGSFYRPWQAEHDRLLSLEISHKEYTHFVQHVQDQLGLVPMTTCFARDCIQPIFDQGFKAIKIASYDCGSHQMIREVADKFDEIIVSTGASYDDEVSLTSKILLESNKRFALLHCVTQYPTPIEMMNINRLSYLSSLSPVVGFSDHSETQSYGIKASMVAVYMGASIIERHLTILPKEQTKDGPVSIKPEHICELLAFASLNKDDQLEYLNTHFPQWNLLLGVASRNLSDVEIQNRSYYRGRFASPRTGSTNLRTEMIHNWEESQP